MNWESWFKISLPAFPVAFTVFGLWLYWRENPIALLPPQIAFWGVVITFYLFAHIVKPDSRAPFFLTSCTSGLWLIANITSHNLAKFIASLTASNRFDFFASPDFWYSYLFALGGFAIALWQFLKHEPRIVEEIERARRMASEET